MMRYLLVAVAAFLTTSTTVRGQNAVPTHPCAQAKAAAARMMLELYGPDGIPAGRPAGVADTDVLHYHLDIEIDPGARWIGGSNTMTVRSLVGGLTLFHFRLHSVFDITALQIGGKPVNWVQVDSATVEVSLDRAYDEGEVFELYVAYDGRPVSQGSWGSITFRTRNGHPEVFTLSSPWFAYTWWPAKDDLEDKTTADLWFTVPDTMTVASNGLLQGVDPVGLDKLRYRWKTVYPTVDYCYCIGATNYDTFETTWDHPGGSMPLKFYIYPENNTPENRDNWLQTVGMLTVYSDLFGEYPFVNEKYGICQFGWGGGMEHQTMTSQSGFWLDITAHELSHQWWGDAVTCATWHDIWLNEGFATYSEALMAENMPGSPGEPALHQYQAYQRPYSVNGSVYVYDIGNMNRVFDYDLTYLKAGWVLHMLRHVVGTDAFYDILAAYRAEFEGRSATTEGFRRVAEDVTGRDLEWFFWEWIYQRGAPRYRVSWRELRADGRPYVEVYVRQTQSFLYPIFTMPVDLELTGPSGTYTQTLWNDGRIEHLLFPIDEAGITNLVFDPKPWILWTERTTVDFVEGPPKIVAMAPEPDAVVASADVPAIEVVFHKDVLVDGTMLSLVGVRSGAVQCAFDYDAVRHAVTLTPAAALASDTYTLAVSDDIIDMAAGKRLDGELVKPDGPKPLPSGDGEPGGNAVAGFMVRSIGDVNCDGLVDGSDVDPFVLALVSPPRYEAEFPGCPLWNADINGDGRVDFGDINPFVDLLDGP